MSADFKWHSVAYFLLGLFRNHDHLQFEIFCYSDVPKPDTRTIELQHSADHWHDTRSLSDQALCELIRADRIDILVDLAGHTEDNRLPVFAQRPAPVQVTWLGYPNTTGLDAIDYRLSDAVADPLEICAAHNTETLVHLPDGFLCYTPNPDAPQVSPAPALRNGYVTFGSFNHLPKVTRTVIKTWAAILKSVPNSRLHLKSLALTEESVRQRYRKYFDAEGIDTTRVIFLDWQSSQQCHLELYRDIDIALDPFPYNGTTTTCEALWMGLPVVALLGEHHAARVSASLLTQLGHTEWIANDRDAYIALAAQLASDAHSLNTIRQALRPKMEKSSLREEAAFARKVEVAFLGMAREHFTEDSLEYSAEPSLTN